MRFEEFIGSRSFALSEGSMYERLRRDQLLTFDTALAHGGLIYDPAGLAALDRLHREYLDVGQIHGLVMFALTDTWRANAERVAASPFRNRPVNEDNVEFLTSLVGSYGADAVSIYVGGQIGPKGDAYTPAEAPPTAQAVRFHAPQVEALATGGVDFLYAGTLPALPEAIGIAQVMSRTGLPYILSFVIRADGTLLDGTPLGEAIEVVDATSPPPTGFGVNCVHPTVFIDGVRAMEARFPRAVGRIVSFQANTSALTPEELVQLTALETEHPDALAARMMEAHALFGTPFFGGCCGTDSSHIEHLALAYEKSFTW